jgi:hypothetical protein
MMGDVSTSPRQGEWSQDDKLDYVIEETKNILLPALKKEMLNAVFFSIAAELRHVFDETGEGAVADDRPAGLDDDEYGAPSEPLEDLASKLGEEYLIIYRKYRRQLNNLTGMTRHRLAQILRQSGYARGIQSTKSYKGVGRLASYQAAMEASPSRSKFVELAKLFYDNLSWELSYGGEAWANITDGWLELNKATDLKTMATMIDHIYDLQHNNDTVFDKVQTYMKNQAYDWLKKALDYKATIENPREIMDKTSSSMRQLSQAALKTMEDKDFSKNTEEFEAKQQVNLKELLSEIPSKARVRTQS